LIALSEFVHAARGAALAVILGTCFTGAVALAASPIPGATPAPPPSRAQDVSLADYRKHLTALTTLVEGCADARDLKSCDPLLVGPDDRIPVISAANAPRRLVRYGWLRVLFSKAEEPDPIAVKAKRPGDKVAESDETEPRQPPTSQLLKDAETRLALDLAQADVAAAVAPQHSLERSTMKDVLEGRDFRGLEQPTARDTFLERVGNWLNKFFENATKWRAQSAWVGRLIVWGFILAVCVALVWGLLQLERKWRLRLVPEDRGPTASAASARTWQLWLDDARRAAAAGQWREAIHFVYWASISRLESRRLWPADRARTPREYLALVAPDDPRKAGLAALTGSFERTWYGGRPAGELDYRNAEELATALIGGGASGTADLSTAEGGAR
jgi:hypothetical protein